MKNFKIKMMLPLIVAFMGVIAFQSCDKDAETINNEENTFEEFKIPETVSNAYVDGLKLPDGTKVVKIDDSTVEFIYPEGIELWIGDDNDNVSKVLYSGGYSCTCSVDNGCNVFYAGGDFGCSHGTCIGTCTGKYSKIANQKKLNYVFVDTNKKLESINNDTEFNDLPYISEMVVKQESVGEILQEFAKEIYGDDYQTYTDRIDKSHLNKTDFDEIVFVKMKLFGYKFLYGMSFNDLKPEVKKKNNFNKVYYGGGHSCNCESGSSGCEKGSRFGVKYCEGGSCTTCKMTI